MAIMTSTITLKANGQDFKAYVAEPPGGGPGILLLHAWWGLKPFFKQVCDRLAEAGFVVVAPDLRQGQIAQTVEQAEELMQKSDDQLTGATVAVARNYLLHLPHLKGRQIGVIGFSMGGQWALTVAAQAAERVGAVVLFYGAGSVDFGVLKARLIGHFSDIDKWEEYDYVKAMFGKMQAAGLEAQLYTYAGKEHWFVEEDRPEYDQRAAKLAWSRTFEFLESSL